MVKRDREVNGCSAAFSVVNTRKNIEVLVYLDTNLNLRTTDVYSQIHTPTTLLLWKEV
jgi:hypothetical protein